MLPPLNVIPKVPTALFTVNAIQPSLAGTQDSLVVVGTDTVNGVGAVRTNVFETVHPLASVTT